MPDLARDESGDVVRVERQGPVAVIRLNRPPVNAINAAMHEPLAAAAAAVSADEQVRCVVLYGGERVFAAGADITEMAALDAHGIAVYISGLATAIDAVAAIRQPVIAAVTGYALGGGCELALAADFRVVADDAVLGLPEITLGVIPGAGGTQRLPRLIGIGRAKELIFGGQPVRGSEAVAIGLASRAVPASDVLTSAMSWAAELAAGPTAALAAAKAAVDGGVDTDLAAGIALEGRLFAGLFDTEDQRVGMATFQERGPGKATFTGR
jgi:enoyl-CoA hydratase